MARKAIVTGSIPMMRYSGHYPYVGLSICWGFIVYFVSSRSGKNATSDKNKANHLPSKKEKESCWWIMFQEFQSLWRSCENKSRLVRPTVMRSWPTPRCLSIETGSTASRRETGPRKYSGKTVSPKACFSSGSRAQPPETSCSPSSTTKRSSTIRSGDEEKTLSSRCRKKKKWVSFCHPIPHSIGCSTVSCYVLRYLNKAIFKRDYWLSLYLVESN